MKIRRAVVGSVVALVAAAATALIAASLFQGGPPNDRLRNTLSDPGASLEKMLVAAGFSPEFVKTFSTVTTRLESSTSGRHRFVQDIPVLSLRREIAVAIHENKRLSLQGARAVQTADGFNVYPLHHAVLEFEGGYDRYQAFFVAYDDLPGGLAERLGLQHRAAHSRWNILPVLHAQSGLLGIVVASVTTTTGGTGDTFVGGVDLGHTHPQAPEARPQPRSDPSLSEIRQMYLDEIGMTQEEFTQQSQEFERQWVESLDAETRTRLQQPENLTPEHIKGEIELAHLVREGETQAQQIERIKLERDAARLQRVGQTVSVLQALAEWMQQALDYRDWKRQLDDAEACLDKRARDAGPEERANIELVRMHLRAAREDVQANTGVRAANSANSALGSGLMTAVPGGALGLASSGINADLRDLSSSSVILALRGVGNCDPPPCPEVQPDGPPTQELLYTPADQQTHTPGPDRSPAPPQVCTGPRAVIEVNATESDGRTIRFRSIVSLNRQEPNTHVGRDFQGKSTGFYREEFTSDQCQFTISWSGHVAVTVLARIAEREVSVDIGGPVTQVGEWPGESCLGGTYYAPNRPLPSRLGYSCRFENVDFTRRGTYRGPPPEETPNPYGCTLDISQLVSARPGTASRR